MTLNLRVLTPNRVVWDSEVEEIISSTNSGQIGVLPNHTTLVTAVDIGIMKIRLNGQWSTMALMGGFARIGNDQITVLVNNAEKGIDIDPREAREAFQIAEADLARAEGKRQAIEANVALKRARTRLEAVSATSTSVSN
jgi:F-type H+-transporting ATPase subunit epsilon